MAIEALGAVGAVDMTRSASIAPSPSSGSDFMTLLDAGMSRVDQSLATADTQLRGLAAGENIAIHDVMISMEKARVELTLMSEVRNRLVEAYQELTRMQL